VGNPIRHLPFLGDGEMAPMYDDFRDGDYDIGFTTLYDYMIISIIHILITILIQKNIDIYIY
jgi:hypothetical protein